MAEVEHETMRLMRTWGKPAMVIASKLDMPRNRLYRWAQDVEKKGDQALRSSGRSEADGDKLAAL